MEFCPGERCHFSYRHNRLGQVELEGYIAARKRVDPNDEVVSVWFMPDEPFDIPHNWSTSSYYPGAFGTDIAYVGEPQSIRIDGFDVGDLL